MAEKRQHPLEAIARAEAEAIGERARAQAERRATAERLNEEGPRAFFALTDQLRAAVERFNRAADPSRRLSYGESPALAARSLEPHGERHLSFGRDQSEITVALVGLSRSGLPDAWIIEAACRLARSRLLVRAEARLRGGKVAFRVTVDLSPIDVPFDEIAERLVLMLVRNDPAALTSPSE
jgi:hypothetical protein